MCQKEVSFRNLNELDNDVNRHFVVATPSTSRSSSESGFETVPLNVPESNERLIEEADAIINQQRQRSGSSVSRGATNIDFSILNENYKMCRLRASKRSNKEACNTLETTC